MSTDRNRVSPLWSLSIAVPFQSASAASDLSGSNDDPVWQAVSLVLVLLLFVLAYGYRTLRRKLSLVVDHQQQLEHQLSRTLHLLDQHVIYSRTDENWVITEASAALSEISGYDRNELIGTPMSAFRAPDVPDSFYDEVRRKVREDHHWSGNLKHQNKQGEFYWVNVDIEPVLDNFGEIIGFTQIRHDVTPQKRLEELWVTDPLTGLYNRNRIDELWEYEIKRAERYGDPLSVILIDIDEFRQINQRFGHLAGDEVIREFGAQLRALCREVDILGRWGGETFLAILPATVLSDAVMLAEKLRQSIQDHRFEKAGQVTLSAAVTSFDSGTRREMLLKSIYEALVRAKDGGRNRVEVAISTNGYQEQVNQERP